MDLLLDSDLDLVVKGGFLYLPLLFDPEVEREVSSGYGGETPEGGSASPGPTVIEVSGRRYLKALRLTSLIELYRNLRHFTAPQEFSAANVIAALEEGLATLYYGYNPRLRNGYHSLDPAMQVRRSLDFMEYRIPSDHADVVSEKVEVTNART